MLASSAPEGRLATGVLDAALNTGNRLQFNSSACSGLDIECRPLLADTTIGDTECLSDWYYARRPGSHC